MKRHKDFWQITEDSLNKSMMAFNIDPNMKDELLNLYKVLSPFQEVPETLKTLKDVIQKAKRLRGEILSIGITNQRETTVLWDKKTGKPVYNAIVWQDRRQEEFCKKLRKQNKDTMVFNKTGLLIDSYFSGTKIKWILDNVPKAKQLMNKKQLFQCLRYFMHQI